ncbi:hypothetical protein OB955_13115 [Halobacteria archaeon AArc-m2/3/4]|uniref:DUF7511 domain-containing protein n=1 Tax=Natronoglomus mannanivorans TaxID=2979990 RepID=A0AAP2YXT9_9EURY|nr:hypothetical protein [Halobacteria archaeon AArc-xg1-1]MCU4973675.1 hypothetical protein [Halobacteria archaeon AArc-m2/3/4]
MSSTHAPVGDETGTESGRSATFEHVVVNDDGATECTIFPSSCDDEEIVTHWLTAKRGSFVDLASMQ